MHHAPPKRHRIVHQIRHRRSARSRRGRQPPPGHPRPAGPPRSRTTVQTAWISSRPPARPRAGPREARETILRPAQGRPRPPSAICACHAHQHTQWRPRRRPTRALGDRWRPLRRLSATTSPPAVPGCRAVAAARWHRHLRERSERGCISRARRGRGNSGAWRQLRRRQ